LTQNEIVYARPATFSPLPNSNPNKIAFEITPAEHLILKTFVLKFVIKLYKNVTNGIPVSFDLTNNDDIGHVSRLTATTNAARIIIPGLRFFPNYKSESTNSTNNYNTSREKNHILDYMERLQYTSNYLKNNYNISMLSYRMDTRDAYWDLDPNEPRAFSLAGLPSRQQTIDHMNGTSLVPDAAGFVPIVPRNGPPAVYQQVLNNRVIDAMVSP